MLFARQCAALSAVTATAGSSELLQRQEGGERLAGLCRRFFWIIGRAGTDAKYFGLDARSKTRVHRLPCGSCRRLTKCNGKGIMVLADGEAVVADMMIQVALVKAWSAFGGIFCEQSL